MFVAKLLASPMRQSVGPTTCRALAHTDIQFPDYYATYGRPSTSDPFKRRRKRTIVTKDQRMRDSEDTSRPLDTPKSPVTRKPVPTPQLVTQYFGQFDSYCQMIKDAKNLAKRSILIDHCGVEHIDLETEFNNVERVYSIEKETTLGYTRLSLIEFASEDDAEQVAKNARHNDGLLPVPLKIFSYIGLPYSSPKQQNLPFPNDKVRLTYKRELSTEFENYTEFISNNVMSLLNLKMRFITLVNLERILCSGIFEEYELMPFGSSVIDLGCDSCDLDLVVTRKENHHEFIKDLLANPDKRYISEVGSKLSHLDKNLYSDAKDPTGVRRTMRWFEMILKDYMPLTDGNGVFFVRFAKVPIVEFTSKTTSLDCDLSFVLDHRVNDVYLTNYNGIIMSQIIFSLCRNNNLFSAVAMYLRIFGRLTSITSKGPNVGLTNFQFLSLILFYLQQISITSQKSRATKDSATQSELIIEETYESQKRKSIVPSFRKLLTEQSFCRTNSVEYDNEQLNQLLPDVILGFFKFYSKFDFANKSMNLYESKLEDKLDNSPIFVTNPLNRSSNICYNVNRKGLDQFVQQARSALQFIDEGGTPLTLIKCLMKKYQRQSKSYYDTHYNLRDNLVSTTEGIAHDIFK